MGAVLNSTRFSTRTGFVSNEKINLSNLRAFYKKTVWTCLGVRYIYDKCIASACRNFQVKLRWGIGKSKTLFAFFKTRATDVF